MVLAVLRRRSSEISMPDTRDPRSVIEAAEQAAAAGDYASAERLLREAAEPFRRPASARSIRMLPTR